MTFGTTTRGNSRRSSIFVWAAGSLKPSPLRNKNGYIYILNRETGQPINPIVETPPVPTKSEVPGEEVWPTQPIPQTAAGKPMTPTASQEVKGELYPQHASYPRLPFYTPAHAQGCGARAARSGALRIPAPSIRRKVSSM